MINFINTYHANSMPNFHISVELVQKV